MAKIKVATLPELPPGAIKQCLVAGYDDIVVANVDGTIYAMRGLCNHAGGPLGDGTIEDNVVTCPWHGAKWDLKTGKNLEFAIDLDPEPVYKVTVDGDDIYVEL
jgi:nitrite reductase/ring-hydroxylating ferredoxin subunit